MHIAHRKYTLNDGPEQPFHQFPPCTLEDIQACIAQYEMEAAQVSDDDYTPSRWEERFDFTHIDAMVHLMHTICKGLPGFVQRWLLRRAARLPGLHGTFGEYNDRMAFLSIEGESIGMSETWIQHENGERRKLW